VNQNGKDLKQTKWVPGKESIDVCKAECDNDLQCSGVEWYEKKKGKNGACKLMLTGWGKNRASAGSTGKQYRDAACYTKNDCSVDTRIELTDASQSTNTSYNVREAGNALDAQEDTIIHTDNEK